MIRASTLPRMRTWQIFVAVIVAAGLGVFGTLALQQRNDMEHSPETSAAAPSDAAAAATDCTIYKAGEGVSVTIYASDAQQACAALIKKLSGTSGYWTYNEGAQQLSGEPVETCVLSKDGASITVSDTGDQLTGRSLCGQWVAAGWQDAYSGE